MKKSKFNFTNKIVMHGEILSNLLKQDILNLENKKDKESLIESLIPAQNNTIDNRECIKPVKKVFIIYNFICGFFWEIYEDF